MFAPEKDGPKWLTVVIRDDSPMVHCNDAPTFRSVQIALTPEQQHEIRLRPTSKSGGTVMYESISRTFFDDEREAGAS